MKWTSDGAFCDFPGGSPPAAGSGSDDVLGSPETRRQGVPRQVHRDWTESDPSSADHKGQANGESSAKSAELSISVNSDKALK